MTGKCQVCGLDSLFEFIEFNSERGVDIYKCYMCSGLNSTVPIVVEKEDNDEDE